MNKVNYTAIVLMIGLLICGGPALSVEVGEKAPDFEFATPEGQIRLKDYLGEKPVYLVFWNSWCPFCIKKTPMYKKLQREYGDEIKIIGINTTWSDSPEDIKAFQERLDINYALTFDNGEVVTDAYEVRNVPTEFIVDIDGVVRYRDGVPQDVAAHIPDWLMPYDGPKRVAELACSK